MLNPHLELNCTIYICLPDTTLSLNPIDLIYAINPVYDTMADLSSLAHALPYRPMHLEFKTHARPNPSLAIKTASL